MPKFSNTIIFQDLLTLYPSQAEGKVGLLIEAKKGLQADGSICPGGYENSLEAMLKDSNRGSNHAYMSMTNFSNQHSTNKQELPANHELAFLQSTSSMKPSIDQALGSNQLIFGCATQIPIQLPVADAFVDVGGMATFDRISWYTQSDSMTKLHMLGSDFGIKCFGQHALLIPGTIQQTFDVTPSGYKLTDFTMSNTILTQYISNEFTKAPLTTENADTYFKTLQQKLLPGFVEDANVSMIAIDAQLADEHTPKDYQSVLILTKQLLERIKSNDANIKGLHAFFTDNLELIKQLREGLPSDLQMYNSSRSRLDKLITAIDTQDYTALQGDLDKNLLPLLLQNHLGYITHATLNRIECMPQEAAKLHHELQSIVADDSDRPEYLKETARFVLEKFPNITPENHANFLKAMDRDFRYMIGYFNYLDWTSEVMAQLQPSLPNVIFQAIQQKIAVANTVDFEHLNNLDGDDRAWAKPLATLHTLFSRFITQSRQEKRFSGLQMVATLPETIKQHFMKYEGSVETVNEAALRTHLKQIDLLGYLAEYAADFTNFDGLFTQAIREVSVEDNCVSEVVKAKPIYLAALIHQQFLNGPLNKTALFGFIETELEQFKRISNNEILALADKLIEKKVATLAKQSGQTDLYSKTHFRYYYNQELFVALQARQEAGLAYLDSKVVATIPTLNDAHFYSEIYTGIAMIGLAVGAMCATAALVIALPEVMVFSAPVIVGDLLLSTQLLQVGIASVFGIMESMMLYNSVQALRNTNASYFSAENITPKAPTTKSSKSATQTMESAKGGADANVSGSGGFPACGDDDSTDVKLGNTASVEEEKSVAHQRYIPIPVF